MSALLCVAVLAALLLAASPASPGNLAEPERQDPPNPEGLRLEMKTDKQMYKREEPVFLTISLRNDGQDTFFSTPKFHIYEHMLSDWQAGQLRIEVESPKGGRLRPTGMMIREMAWQAEKHPLSEFIIRTRIPLEPGGARQLTRSLRRLGYSINKPGRYRLRARYIEPSYQSLVSAEEFDRAVNQLGYPWWANLNSGWVEIEIVD